jgi:hypothetical protein
MNDEDDRTPRADSIGKWRRSSWVGLRILRVERRNIAALGRHRRDPSRPNRHGDRGQLREPYGLGGARHPESGARLVTTARPGMELAMSAQKSIPSSTPTAAPNPPLGRDPAGPYAVRFADTGLRHASTTGQPTPIGHIGMLNTESVAARSGSVGPVSCKGSPGEACGGCVLGCWGAQLVGLVGVAASNDTSGSRGASLRGFVATGRARGCKIAG